ncbi:hypothetical protein FHS78_002948 [Parvibaculum indicum]|uniref:DUF411 domain-containing protein n=1 Tax=Parvibaculum indicum TaxID=562969 RepID=UPI001FEA877B|nr:DUF411 domain-containing protein [Parvibaculum indicum]NIJ42643.1 hypothetical protein [Parvibaculum indicum]
MKIDRRKMLLGGMAVLGSVALSPLASLPARAAVIRGTAYKAPGCGCCELWADHMREAGFEIRMLEDSDLAVRKIRHGITSDLASCHTALIEGYVVEGHVPASVVRRLLKERPEGVTGISVPGMPVGTPGMPGPKAGPVDVLAFGNGRPKVYATF